MPNLNLKFFEREAPIVARDLLGKIIVHRTPSTILAARIVETEAYLGEADPASHAFRGPTKRNQAMFTHGGACYVYLSYGVHFCVNVVTGIVGQGEAVLLRAALPITTEQIYKNRNISPEKTPPFRLIDGPGKLTTGLAITLADNGKTFVSETLYIFDDGEKIKPKNVSTTPRIGITKAVDLPLRFMLKREEWPVYYNEKCLNGTFLEKL